MAYPPAVVLVLPLSSPEILAPFVERCIIDRVALIAVWGAESEAIEDEIDWLIIGDAADDSRFITTSSHVGQPLEEAIDMAQHWITKDGRSGCEIVRL